MMDEREFQKKCDAAFEELKRRLLPLSDEHGFDVEGESGKVEVIFEEPEEATFVISPNTPVREIWISALSTRVCVARACPARTQLRACRRSQNPPRLPHQRP